MRMTRRDLLVRVFGAATAASVTPLLDMTDMTPAFWNQAPLKELMRWRIAFPDGTLATFEWTTEHGAKRAIPSDDVERGRPDADRGY